MRYCLEEIKYFFLIILKVCFKSGENNLKSFIENTCKKLFVFGAIAPQEWGSGGNSPLPPPPEALNGNFPYSVSQTFFLFVLEAMLIFTLFRAMLYLLCYV